MFQSCLMLFPWFVHVFSMLKNTKKDTHRVRCSAADLDWDDEALSAALGAAEAEAQKA